MFSNIDNAEFATNGSKLSWASTFSGGGILGGNENYHKHTFNFKWYTPIFSKFVLYKILGTAWRCIGNTCGIFGYVYNYLL